MATNQTEQMIENAIRQIDATPLDKILDNLMDALVDYKIDSSDATRFEVREHVTAALHKFTMEEIGVEKLLESNKRIAMLQSMAKQNRIN